MGWELEGEEDDRRPKAEGLRNEAGRRPGGVYRGNLTAAGRRTALPALKHTAVKRKINAAVRTGAVGLAWP